MKAYSSINVTDDGITKVPVKPLQPLKAYESIDETVVGIVNVPVKPEQSLKAEVPIY